MRLFPLTAKVVKHLQMRTKCKNTKLFAGMADFYWGTVASSLGVKIAGWQPTLVPVNNYMVNLATSGFGKGVSKNFIEEELLVDFLDYFNYYIVPHRTESLQDNTELKFNQTEYSYAKLTEICKGLGELPYSFDSCTSAAIRQLNQKVVMLGLGSLNLIVDEIGYNFNEISEGLTQYLNLYDMGKLDSKVTKSYKENARNPFFRGNSPANMLLFGTPHQLLNVPSTRNLFINWLASGGARRSLTFLEDKVIPDTSITPEQEYEYLTSEETINDISALRNYFYSLALDSSNVGKVLKLSKEAHTILREYQNANRSVTKSISTREDDIVATSKAHGHWRALKLAGTYAFMRKSDSIDVSDVEYALAKVEEGNQDIAKIVENVEPHTKIATYLSETPERVSLNNLAKFVPELKQNQQQKQMLISLAQNELYDRGYIMSVVRHKGVEHLQAKRLEETSLDKLYICLSTHMAENFIPKIASLDDLAKLGNCMQPENTWGEVLPFYWTNHEFVGNHRNEANTVEGFNLLVLDIDEGLALEDAKTLLANYTYVIYTTKRHTEALNRFRIILPSKYKLYLSKEAYEGLYRELKGLFPFDFDKGSGERCRMWGSNVGQVYVNKGKLFDPLPYVMDTKNDNVVASAVSVSGARAYVKRECLEGNRNNLLFWYVTKLENSGYSSKQIRDEVIELNKELENGLSKTELDSTILRKHLQE